MSVPARSSQPRRLRPPAQGCRFGYPGKRERLILQPQRGCACFADFSNANANRVAVRIPLLVPRVKRQPHPRAAARGDPGAGGRTVGASKPKPVLFFLLFPTGNPRCERFVICKLTPFPFPSQFGFSLASQYNLLVLKNLYSNSPNPVPSALLLKPSDEGVRPWRSV